MKLFKFSFRNEEQQEVDAVETWEVRWESRFGEWSGNTQPEIRVFTNESDANSFAKALRDAFKLIRHTSGTKVRVSKVEG